MVYVIIFVVVLAALVYIATKKVNDNIIRKSNALPFKESMDLIDLPVVTFCNNGKKLHFLLDTGSDDSYINSDIVSTLEVKKKLMHNREIITGNGIIKSDCKVLLDITYKDNTFENVFIVSDMGPAFDELANSRGITVHGILGSTFFNVYNYVLDFKEMIAYSKK